MEQNTKLGYDPLKIIFFILVVIFAALGIYYLATKDNIKTNEGIAESAVQQPSQKTSIDASKPIEPPKTSTVKATAYSVYKTENLSDKTTVWIVTKPFDYSNESFKDQVKAIISAESMKMTTSQKSIHVYTSEAVAKADTTPDGDPRSVDPAGKVAWYLYTNTPKYDGIAWFGLADSSTPVVGKYASFEKWIAN